jgi:hypothetical protein
MELFQLMGPLGCFWPDKPEYLQSCLLNMPFDSSSRILIGGGTGSCGKAFIAEMLRRFLRLSVKYHQVEAPMDVKSLAGFSSGM